MNYNLVIKFSGEKLMTNDNDIPYYPDTNEYFLVKTWDDFDNAKKEALNILENFSKNISLKCYDSVVNRLLQRTIDFCIHSLMILNEKEIIIKELSYLNLSIRFVHILDYDIKSFKLHERLEKLKEKILDYDCSTDYIVNSIHNLLEGREYYEDVIEDDNRYTYVYETKLNYEVPADEPVMIDLEIKPIDKFIKKNL